MDNDTGDMLKAGNEMYRHEVLPTVTKSVIYMTCIVTFIIGATTNAAVIYIIGIKQRFVKRFDVFLVSLASTDFLASIFLPLVTIHDLATDRTGWYLLGNPGCKVIQSMVPFTAMVSSIMLVLIATGRLRVIKSSVPLPQVRCQTFTETLLVWFFSFVIIVPRITFTEINNGRCEDPFWHKHYSYYVLTESLVCILPLCSMMIVYTASSYVMMTRNLPVSKRVSTKRRKQYKNMSKMFFILVCVYITCSAPHSVLIFVLDHKRHHGNDSERYTTTEKLYLRNGARILLAINYCINPYFYAKMHQSLGKYLHLIKSSLRRLTRRHHQKDERELRETRSNSFFNQEQKSSVQQSLELINRQSIERTAEGDDNNNISKNNKNENKANDKRTRRQIVSRNISNISTNSYLIY